MIETAADGIIIHLKVIPRAGRSEIAGVRDNLLLVRLNAPPVDGAANDELIALLAGVLGVPKRAVSIVTGTTARRKRVRITGVTADRAASRLPH
ncbi:MAG TPA: DUF167 domain-containing protein [Vicinamibacterales bacterium]|nr:DUF167 domain-containing protein [Vicinamibacterales bacterium]